MKIRTLITLCLGFFLISCIGADGGDFIQEINNDVLEKIELSEKHLEMNVGEEVLLCDLLTIKLLSGHEKIVSVMHYPSNITVPEYNWLSTDPMVIQVRENKLVGILPGTAYLIVRVKGLKKEASCEVTVK